MKRFIPFILVVMFLMPVVSWGQTNPGFESGDLTGWTDASTGTETNSIANVRTGTRNLSYSTNNSSSQRMENLATFSVPNSSYLHCIAWAIGSNADAKAGVTIYNGTGWNGATTSNIGTTLTRLTHIRQNISGSTVTTFQVGLNSLKVTNATVLYWDDIVAYVSTSATTDLTAPGAATAANTNSNEGGTAITITWSDGVDAATGSQEAIILRASGLNQTPPTLNDQGRYSVVGGSSGPNTVGSWTVVGVVNVGTQTFTDNTSVANQQYTYAVYMHDLAYNYSTGTSSSITALPVELTSFTASLADNGVQLNWETATEVNNYGFNVERAIGSWQGTSASLSASWETLGFVQGHGNSNSPKSYSFTDATAPAGKVQYRLKQIDFDGKFEYSDVVEVNVDAPAKIVLEQNHPNPFNPETTISYTIPSNLPDGKAGVKGETINVTLKVFDALGREVAILVDEFKQAGNYKVTFNVRHLERSREIPSGVYFCTLKAGAYVETKKMVLIK